MTDTILTDLQADIAARLRADSFFSDIAVIDERKADVVGDIAKALGVMTVTGGKLGICAVVLSPMADDEMPDAVFGPMEVVITVRVLENVLFNTGASGTGKAALTVARRIHRVLKHYHPLGLAQPLRPKNPGIIGVADALAPLAYEVQFATTEADAGRELKCTAPSISSVGEEIPQTVSMASNTPGASIYYTLDGTHPAAGNTAAVLYTVPFQVATAKTVRAAAYLTGYVASDVNWKRFVKPPYGVNNPITNGLLLDVDFSNPATIFSDTGRTTLAVDGGAIKGVRDLSGTGNHLTQGTTGRCPIFRNGTTNATRYGDFYQDNAAYGSNADMPHMLFTNPLSTIRTVVWVMERLRNPDPNANTGLRCFLLGHATATDFHSDVTTGNNGYFHVSYAPLVESMRVNGVVQDKSTFTRLSARHLVTMGASGNMLADSFSLDRTGFYNTFRGYLFRLAIYDRVLSLSELEFIESTFLDGYEIVVQ